MKMQEQEGREFPLKTLMKIEEMENVIMLTLVWTVTYRMDSKSPQKEIKKYTKESAELMASNIMELGGLAVITEDVEEAPEAVAEDLALPLSSNQPKLNWS